MPVELRLPCQGHDRKPVRGRTLQTLPETHEIKKLLFICKLQIKFLSLQRERRSQVEPRCAERWHGCRDSCGDDEQFDLAAWFPSLIYSWSRVDQLLYFPILRQCKLRWVLYPRGSNEIHISYQFTTNLHFIVRMNNELWWSYTSFRRIICPRIT